jgi:hypothetical protein
MRSSFLFRIVVLLVCCWGSIMAAHASHALSADITYEYAGTTASPYQYRVIVHLCGDVLTAVDDPTITLTCGKNECGNTLPGSFTTMLTRTSMVLVNTNCTGVSSGLSYRLSTLEGLVQLTPAYWTLSIEASNRRNGVINIASSGTQSLFVKAELNNTNGLVNSSPKFTTNRLIQLTDVQPQQHYSAAAFDVEGDSLVYRLMQPLANPTAALPCGSATVGALAPHFGLNARTGELLTVAGPVQQGFYWMAVQVDEYRRLNGNWQQIGSIRRDMMYVVVLGANQPPAFTRVALASNSGSQLLGQTISVNPGQLLSLSLTAADPDASQMLTMTSSLPGTVPGVTFQDLGSGQAQLNWQVPATLPFGRYQLTVSAIDSYCPAPGATVLTIPVLVTQQVLATRTRQPLMQQPFPMPFQDEVRFQFTGVGMQPVIIADELGRMVGRLTTATDGSVVWRPASHLSAGLYFARNLDGTQVARLAYAGK